MSIYIPVSLRTKIQEADRRRCCYCLTTQENSGISMAFDHIHPRSKGGESSFQNVCLACRSCNEFKSDITEDQDPLTEEIVSLFNPRTQKWDDHFCWSADSTRVEAKTAIGRVTVMVLQMNNSAIVTARRRWASASWHPPVD